MEAWFQRRTRNLPRLRRSMGMGVISKQQSGGREDAELKEIDGERQKERIDGSQLCGSA